MLKNLPRILLVSESTLNKQGKGADRTLLNLFENYPAELLMLFSPQNYLKEEATASPFDQRVMPFPGYYVPSIRNRVGKFINPLISTVNLQLLDWLPIPARKELEKFAPEIILICPITSWCLLTGHKLTQYFQCPFVIYFLDDWIATDKLHWLSGSIKEVAYKLLKESAGWLMISEQLQAELSSRYQLTPQKSLIVHNPVDLSGKQPPDIVTNREGTFKVIYAGSIWQMHYDAVAVIAEAIFQLRCDGKDIELVLHTDEFFWNLYQKKWQLWEVTYDGCLIPYNALNQYLKSADLLLVASSFLPEHAHMTRCSVQTKLTDYMASGKPILACGPAYSACNQFLKKWQCGVVCETNQVSDVKEILLEQLSNWYSNQKIATLAFEILKYNFEKNVISNKLYTFLKSCVKIKNKQETYAN